MKELAQQIAKAIMEISEGPSEGNVATYLISDPKDPRRLNLYADMDRRIFFLKAVARLFLQEHPIMLAQSTYSYTPNVPSLGTVVDYFTGAAGIVSSVPVTDKTIDQSTDKKIDKSVYLPEQFIILVWQILSAMTGQSENKKNALVALIKRNTNKLIVDDSEIVEKSIGKHILQAYIHDDKNPSIPLGTLHFDISQEGYEDKIQALFKLESELCIITLTLLQQLKTYFPSESSKTADAKMKSFAWILQIALSNFYIHPVINQSHKKSRIVQIPTVEAVRKEAEQNALAKEKAKKEEAERQRAETEAKNRILSVRIIETRDKIEALYKEFSARISDVEKELNAQREFAHTVMQDLKSLYNNNAHDLEKFKLQNTYQVSFFSELTTAFPQIIMEAKALAAVAKDLENVRKYENDVAGYSDFIENMCDRYDTNATRVGLEVDIQNFQEKLKATREKLKQYLETAEKYFVEVRDQVPTESKKLGDEIAPWQKEISEIKRANEQNKLKIDAKTQGYSTKQSEISAADAKWKSGSQPILTAFSQVQQNLVAKFNKRYSAKFTANDFKPSDQSQNESIKKLSARWWDGWKGIIVPIPFFRPFMNWWKCSSENVKTRQEKVRKAIDVFKAVEEKKPIVEAMGEDRWLIEKPLLTSYANNLTIYKQTEATYEARKTELEQQATAIDAELKKLKKVPTQAARIEELEQNIQYNEDQQKELAGIQQKVDSTREKIIGIKAIVTDPEKSAKVAFESYKARAKQGLQAPCDSVAKDTTQGSSPLSELVPPTPSRTLVC